MKLNKYYILVILSLVAIQSYAQRIGNLDGINYQAIALDANGEEIVGLDLEEQPLYEKTITVRFSIMKGNAGPIQFQETHETITDKDGMFSLVIGQGTQTGAGQYAALLDMPWIDADQWLQVEIAVGDEDFRRVSLEKFQTVPYSFYTDDIADDAITTEKILNGEILNEDIADGTIDLTAKVQNILPVANGGTGRSEVAAGNIMIGNDTNAFDTLAVYDSAMLFSNKGGTTELYKLRPGPRTSISVDEVNKVITITALDQSADNRGTGSVSVPNLSPGDQVERNFPSSNVQPGDIILATILQDLKGLTMTAYVRIAGQVNVIFYNGSNQLVNLGPVDVRFANFGQP